MVIESTGLGGHPLPRPVSDGRVERDLERVRDSHGRDSAIGQDCKPIAANWSTHEVHLKSCVLDVKTSDGPTDLRAVTAVPRTTPYNFDAFSVGWVGIVRVLTGGFVGFRGVGLTFFRACWTDIGSGSRDPVP